MNKEAEAMPCPGCGQPVRCGIAAGNPSCWCMALPVGLPLPGGDARCYCADCLKRLAAASPGVRED